MRRQRSHARQRAALAALLAAVLAAGMLPVPASADMSGYEVVVGPASAGYRYQVVSQGAGVGFEQPDFNAEAFADGAAVFGTPNGDCGADDHIGTTWAPQTDLLVRRTITVPADGRQLHLAIGVVGAAQVFVNGTELTEGLVLGNDYCPGRDDIHVKVPEAVLDRGGANLVAIRARSLPASAYFDMQAILVPAPANDDAAAALDASSLPFTDELPFMGASLEDGEPTDICGYRGMCTTAWYRLSVAEPTRLVIDAGLPGPDETWPLGIAVYTGDPFGSLVLLLTRQEWEWRPLLLQAQPGTTYLVQVAGFMRLTSYGPGAVVTVSEAADPVAMISSWPDSPVTTATEVHFWAEVNDPAGQPVASYAWDFGDGTTSEGDSGVGHYFKQAGVFDVVLAIVMADGRRATATVPYTVTKFEGVPPEASFTWTPDAPDHLTDVWFAATASDPSFVGIESYRWDFGDGATGMGETVWHRFAAGTHTVTLTVETFDGRTTVVQHSVTVTQRQMDDPLAGFWMWPSQPYAGQDVTFYDQSWDPEYVGIASQSWAFGDGTFATGWSASHAYATPGTYTVTLTVATWDGRTGTTTQDVTVTPPPPPVVDLGAYPGDPSSYDEVQFYGWAWDPMGGPIESFRWDFGDGATSAEWYPVHRYAADGAYTVSLAVRTPDGREASTSRTLQVATHDAAIIKLTTARSASAGQTKPITADITSRGYPETVTVQLFKGTPQGFTFLAEKRIAVKEGKTVRVTFNYRFTAADASIGRVTFKVVTLLDGYRDALPADNEALTSPTKVAK